jgi:hypothetical protein
MYHASVICKYGSVDLLPYMACNGILQRSIVMSIHYMEPFAGHFLNHVDLMMMQWVPRR